MKVDARFEAIDPAGKIVQCTLRRLDASSSLLDVIYLDQDPEVEESRISLFISLLKGRKMDLVVRQATECGVRRIVPLRSKPSVTDIPLDRIDDRLKRWGRIAKEAMQQSGSRAAPEIVTPIEVQRIDDVWQQSGPGYVCHQERLETSGFLDTLLVSPTDVALGVGPEGGFDNDEIEHFTEAGFQPLFLGRRVLRSETAVVFTIGAIRHMLGVR